MNRVDDWQKYTLKTKHHLALTWMSFNKVRPKQVLGMGSIAADGAGERSGPPISEAQIAVDAVEETVGKSSVIISIK